MLKNVAVIAACALAVVLAWRLGSGENGGLGTGLPDQAFREDPNAPEKDAATRAERISAKVISPVTGRSHGVVSTRHRGRFGLPSDHPVAKGLARLYELGYGTNPDRMSRAQVQRAVYELRRSLKPEDIDPLVQAFENTDDRGFRWGLSFVLQHVKDDRVVPALGMLFDTDPMRAGEALALVGSDKAIEEISSRMPTVDREDKRAHLGLRIMRSNWEGGGVWFDRLMANTSTSDYERLDAVTALGWRPIEEGLPKAMDIAFGPPRPLSKLGDLETSHPSKDLRSGAVLAILRYGDVSSMRKLIEHVDRSGDQQLETMIDRNLTAFASRGPDVSEFFFQRIERLQRITPGVASYLGRVCGTKDISRLQALKSLAGSDARTLEAIEHAIIASSRR